MIKMGWEHCQIADHPKRELKVGRGLFGVHLLILQFNFQFSKSIKSSSFHIFLNLIHIPFPKRSKITKKFTKRLQTLVNEINEGI